MASASWTLFFTLLLAHVATAQIPIRNCIELQNMANRTGSYILDNDIDCSATAAWNEGAGFEPVGNKTHPFEGRLNGAGFSISNLFINRTNETYVGIFGRTNAAAVLGNITLREVSIAGYEYVGGLVGENECPISNCSVTGNLSAVKSRVGGLAGENEGDFAHCYGIAQISGGSNAGGLVGDDDGGTYTQCYFTGTVTGTNEIGGLIGELASTGVVIDSFFSGTVFGEEHGIGGLIGENVRGSLIRCNTSGTVSGLTSLVGGLVGDDDGGDYTQCSSTATVSGFEYVGGLLGELSPGGTLENCFASGTVHAEGSLAGGLVGGDAAGSLVNCYSSGTVSSEGNYVGGLTGDDDGGSYIHCHSTATVSGAGFVGGLVGNLQGSLQESYSTATVSGTGNFVGGAVGENTETASIESCYAEGSVTGFSRVGALVGENRGNIETSFAVGRTLGGAPVGGLVGSDTGTVSSCYWDVDTTEQSNSAGIGASGRTTTQMYQEATFILWPFGATWWIDEGCDYPRLKELTPVPVELGCPTLTLTATPSVSPIPQDGNNAGEGNTALIATVVTAVLGLLATLIYLAWKAKNKREQFAFDKEKRDHEREMMQREKARELPSGSVSV